MLGRDVTSHSLEVIANQGPASVHLVLGGLLDREAQIVVEQIVLEKSRFVADKNFKVPAIFYRLPTVWF